MSDVFQTQLKRFVKKYYPYSSVLRTSRNFPRWGLRRWSLYNVKKNCRYNFKHWVRKC